MRIALLLRVSFALFGSVTVWSCVADSGSSLRPGQTDSGTTSSTSSSSTSSTSSSSGGADAAPDSPAPTCGVPTKACCAGSSCNGGSICENNVCKCGAGMNVCDDKCTDIKTDPENCGRCGHGCNGGTCTGGTCDAVTVTTAQATTSNLAVAKGRVYWTRRGNVNVKGGLFSNKLDGSDPQTHYELKPSEPCSGLAIAKDQLFVMCKTPDVATKELRTCDINNCASTTVVKAGLSANASSVAADPVSGMAYYAVATSYGNPPDGGIFKKDGTKIGTTTQANPGSLQVSGAYLYWLNAGTYANNVPQKNGGVMRVDLATLADVKTVITAQNTYFDNSSLAVDSLNVYYIGRNDIVAGTNDMVHGGISGGTQAVFRANTKGTEVAADGVNVYFDDDIANRIVYCPRTGCGTLPTVLSQGEDAITTIIVEEKNIFWARQDGQIRRVAKP